MNDETTRESRHVRRDIHPAVGLAVVGLTVWLVLAAWAGFSAGGYDDFLLVVVSFFFLIAVAIPVISLPVWRHHRPAKERPRRHSLVAWLLSDFDTSSGRLKGSQAAVQILLPIMAVSFGMAAFGIALYVAERMAT
jgi:uncharacterized membrane protein YhaH (DUF805 family)